MSGTRILAAGLSPAWQQILSCLRLEVGEVNRASEAHWCASGKVLNVAQACRSLGADTAAVTILGGPNGQAIAREMQQLDILLQYTDTSVNTRVCTTLLDRSSQQTTELVENAAPVSAETLDDFARRFTALAEEAALVVFTGSLPAGTPPDFVRRLLESLEVPVILDIRGSELKACLPLRPFIVKPNIEELGFTFPEIGGPGIDRPGQLMAQAIRLGAEHLVVSQGKQGLYLMTGDRLSHFTAPEVPVINPIGCGDCLAAGIAVATVEGADLTEAIRFGIGAAAQNASLLLPARLDRATASRLADEVHVTSAQTSG